MRILGMWSHNLRERRSETAFHEVLEVLQIADLTCDLEAFTIGSTTIIEHTHCLVAVVYSAVEDEVLVLRSHCLQLGSRAVDVQLNVETFLKKICICLPDLFL